MYNLLLIVTHKKSVFLLKTLLSLVLCSYSEPTLHNIIITKIVMAIRRINVPVTTPAMPQFLANSDAL